MAIDTQNNRQSVTFILPQPSGAVTRSDHPQVTGIYRGIPMPIAVGGNLSFSGAVDPATSYHTTVSGNLSFTGIPSPAAQFRRSLSGNLSLSGSNAQHLIIRTTLSGTLLFTGSADAASPYWFKIPDNLQWYGEWTATTVYPELAVVLYRTSDGNWHPFVSKSSHNVNHIPTTSYQYWTRLKQGRWES